MYLFIYSFVRGVERCKIYVWPNRCMHGMGVANSKLHAATICMLPQEKWLTCSLILLAIAPLFLTPMNFLSYRSVLQLTILFCSRWRIVSGQGTLLVVAE